MKPTHQSIERGYDVTAWQFSRTTPIPIWVARTFHFINNQWQCLSKDQKLIIAKEGDWVVTSSEADGRAFVVTNAEFTQIFRQFPSAITPS